MSRMRMMNIDIHNFIISLPLALDTSTDTTGPDDHNAGVEVLHDL